ncbi:hypothetical protein D3C86_1327580 [compost metagenome]
MGLAQELVLGLLVARGAIAADGHADEAGRAALALGLVDRVHDALADAVQVTVGLAQLGQLAGQRVLDVLVLAAAALEDQLDLDDVLLPLLEVDDRGAGAQVVTGVGAGQAVHRVGAQLAVVGGAGHGLADGRLDLELVGAHRGVDEEGGHARVLAQGQDALGGHVHVLGDGRKGDPRAGSGVLAGLGVGEGLSHVGGQVGRGLDDQGVEALFELRQSHGR